MVNGPEDATLSWEAVDWRHHEGNVRRLRQRIFTAAQEGNSTTHLSRPRGLLELLAVKAARAVLRGDRRSNPPVLPDQAALLAGMGRSTTQFDPVTHPEAALQRRNLVIQQMLGQGMIDQAQAQEASVEPLGIANPLGTVQNGCIGAGDAGFFCKYVTDYLAQAGLATQQIQRGGYTIHTTLDPNTMEKMKASLNAEVPAGAPNVADAMAIVAPGQDHHKVLAMGSSRTFGLDAI